jgi:hypothetical protein
LFHKPDRSRVNQTGHLDLLTTELNLVCQRKVRSSGFVQNEKFRF